MAYLFTLGLGEIGYSPLGDHEREIGTKKKYRSAYNPSTLLLMPQGSEDTIIKDLFNAGSYGQRMLLQALVDSPYEHMKFIQTQLEQPIPYWSLNLTLFGLKIREEDTEALYSIQQLFAQDVREVRQPKFTTDISGVSALARQFGFGGLITDFDMAIRSSDISTRDGSQQGKHFIFNADFLARVPIHIPPGLELSSEEIAG